MKLTAADIQNWPAHLNAEEWPDGVLERMNIKVHTDIIFPMRINTNVPMWPSKLYEAHVRDEGRSQHSTSRKGCNGLSDATDMHCSSYRQLVELMDWAEDEALVGGVGIYFDTRSPMIHVDRFATRGKKLTWLRSSAGEYIYKQADPVKFYHQLSEELKLKGVFGKE